MNNDFLNYIELRKNGNLKDYLKYFPEYSKSFNDYRNKIHILSNELYNNYKNCYIFKNTEKKDIPYHLKPLTEDIHKIYIETKKEVLTEKEESTTKIDDLEQVVEKVLKELT